MKPEVKLAVNIVMNILNLTINETIEHLYYSRAINTDDYENREFMLAKILISAALETHRNDFVMEQYKSEIKNLVDI